jgi:hypothetical protein
MDPDAAGCEREQRHHSRAGEHQPLRDQRRLALSLLTGRTFAVEPGFLPDAGGQQQVLAAEAVDIEFLTPEPPPPVQDLPEEPWLPARDVTLMTIVAFASLALAATTEIG